MIQFSDVSFSYRTHTGVVPAVRSVTLALARGELLAVLGANGSGKSTIAQLANGLLQPDSGTVTVDDMSTGDEQHVYDLRSRVGIVFQNPENQIVATTVEEDVAFGPENLGLPRSALRERVDEALEAVGLTELADNEPHQLSGGQKQRLAVAGALAMRPAYLILDEPASMLDPRGRAEVAELIRKLKLAGHGIAVITHDLSILGVADRVLVLDAGAVAFEGAPAALMELQQAALDGWGLELPPLGMMGSLLRDLGAPAPNWADTPQSLVNALCR